MQSLAVRPPYVEFYTECRETKDSVGNIIYTDIPMVKITPHGSKDCVDKPVSDWFDSLGQQVQAGRFDPEWVRQYKGAFEEWKKTGEIPIDGTPLSNWPVLTKSELRRLHDLHLRSVEDLAGCNEEVLTRIGMGARGLKAKAVDWITAQKGNGPLVTQLESLRNVNATLQAKVDAQATELTTLSAQMAFIQQQMLAGQANMGQPMAAPVHKPAEMPSDDDLVSTTIDQLVG